MQQLLTPRIPKEFSDYFAAWLRLEPRCRKNDIESGLEARLADPLWMLARQWQFGEFSAEDAGSPIVATVKASCQPVSRVRLADGVPIPLNGRPVEVVVEQMPIETDWRIRVQMGQQFERYLLETTPLLDLDSAREIIRVLRLESIAAIKAVSDDPSTEIDSATQRFLSLVAGRAIDGYQVLNQTDALVNGLKDNKANVRAAAELLRGWFRELYAQPQPEADSAWQPSRLDYRFTLPLDKDSSPALVASNYRNGDFDWYSCNLCGEAHLGDKLETGLYMPVQVSYSGMPNARWWAFEDAQLDFGDLDVETPELAKLMLMEFALVYGNDWFVIPLTVKAGSLVHIDELHVTDVFGQKVKVEPYTTGEYGALNRWQLYSLTRSGAPGEAGTENLLFVPQTVYPWEESLPLEEVYFKRDETANLVWAIEHLALNGIGDPVDRHSAYSKRFARENNAPASPHSGEAETPPGNKDLPHYRLVTDTPPNRIPFIPVQTGIGAIRLQRAKAFQNADGLSPNTDQAQTRLLRLDGHDLPLLSLHEESIPRAGVRVQLTKQRVRTPDGATFVWLGKKILVGSGEAKSGLKFDVLEDSGDSRSK